MYEVTTVRFFWDKWGEVCEQTGLTGLQKHKDFAFGIQTKDWEQPKKAACPTSMKAQQNFQLSANSP